MWTSFIGFTGSGKSAVAGVVSRGTSLPALDLDREVEKHAGRTIVEIFRDGGAREFRAVEQRVLNGLNPDRSLVLATGSGTVDRPDHRRILREHGVVVWLDAPWEVLRGRIVGMGSAREPMVRHLGWAGLARLYRYRQRQYAAAAHFRLNTQGADIGGVARAALLRSMLWQKRNAGSGA
jgi:shikimate kinase